MTSTSTPFAAPADGRDVFNRTTDAWAQSVQQLFGQIPAMNAPAVDYSAFVDRYFDTFGRFSERWIEFNRSYVKGVADAVSAAQRSVLERASSMGEALREQVASTSDVVRQQVEAAGELAEEQAAATERETRTRQRQAARQAREAAAEPFRDMTKVELQEQLALRDLPKTGNVDELRVRLVEAELEASPR